MSNWKIKIDDSYCEWEYCLEGGGQFSIQDLVNIIIAHTQMSVIDEHLVVENKTDKKKKLRNRIAELESELDTTKQKLTDCEARNAELEKNIAKAKDILAEEACEWLNTAPAYTPDYVETLKRAWNVLSGKASEK